MKRSLLITAAALSLVVFLPFPVLAEYPEKPIKIIVPFKPGGMSTQVVTMVKKVLQANPDILGAPLAVIHVPGAAGSIGARRVMEAEPDGYEFLQIHLALMSRQAAGLVDFGYKNFEPVVQAVGTCIVPVVHETSPYQTLPALLDAAKQKPDSIIFGVNLGALNHMSGITLQNSSPGSKFRFVQAGAGNAVFVALKGGHIDAGVFSIGVYNKFKPGGSRGLALMAEDRYLGMPELPTAKELGYDATFCFENWWFAPKGTPQYAIDHFANAIEKVLETEEAKEFMKTKFFIRAYSRGEALKKHMDDVWSKIEPVAKQVKGAKKK
jgi:tripartite-type tricarboxylate transporter receptor subunit TctC